jgi:2-aminoadipate transaminase
VTEPTINLTRGIPPAEVFPAQDLTECQEVALKRDPDVLLQYGRSPGYAPLREWLAEQYGVSPHQILLGNSSLEVFAFITQLLLQPGDHAFVESPSYDRAITLLRRTGAQVVGITLEQDGVNMAAFERQLQDSVPTLVYVIADFQNPMGVTTSLEKRQRLVDLAQQHDFWIVEDAPYRQLRYRGEDIPSLWSLARDRVLHMSSFSKILAPGLRLGYVIGPPDTIAELAAWAVDWYIGPVLPTQGMVYEYCRRGLLDDNIARLKDIYRPRLDALVSALEEHVPEATWSHPEGGFFVGGMLPEGQDVVSLKARADQAGLKLSDGHGFFPNPEDGTRFLRIPFCSLTPAEIDDAIPRLAQLLERVH